VPLELGRHLVCGAVDHARRSGFEPAPDFRDTAGHLGEWTETSRITFGRDGVPFYVSGPYDNPRSVVRTLDRTCGEGNTTTSSARAEQLPVVPETAHAPTSATRRRRDVRNVRHRPVHTGSGGLCVLTPRNATPAGSAMITSK